MKVRLSGIQVKIIWKLRRSKKYGGSHTAIETASKGFPSHLHGDVREALRGLVKLGLISTKMTGYGLQIALNPHQTHVINRICDWYVGMAGRLDPLQTCEIDV